LKGIEKHNAEVKAYEGGAEKDRELLVRKQAQVLDAQDNERKLGLLDRILSDGRSNGLQLPANLVKYRGNIVSQCLGRHSGRLFILASQ
jgi:hypothetical protein